jgi:hypothetical protein
MPIASQPFLHLLNSAVCLHFIQPDSGLIARFCPTWYSYENDLLAKRYQREFTSREDDQAAWARGGAHNTSGEKRHYKSMCVRLPNGRYEDSASIKFPPVIEYTTEGRIESIANWRRGNRLHVRFSLSVTHFMATGVSVWHLILKPDTNDKDSNIGSDGMTELDVISLIKLYNSIHENTHLHEGTEFYWKHNSTDAERFESVEAFVVALIHASEGIGSISTTSDKNSMLKLFMNLQGAVINYSYDFMLRIVKQVQRENLKNGADILDLYRHIMPLIDTAYRPVGEAARSAVSDSNPSELENYHTELKRFMDSIQVSRERLETNNLVDVMENYPDWVQAKCNVEVARSHVVWCNTLQQGNVHLSTAIKNRNKALSTLEKARISRILSNGKRRFKCKNLMLRGGTVEIITNQSEKATSDTDQSCALELLIQSRQSDSDSKAADLIVDILKKNNVQDSLTLEVFKTDYYDYFKNERNLRKDDSVISPESAYSGLQAMANHIKAYIGIVSGLFDYAELDGIETADTIDTKPLDQVQYLGFQRSTLINLLRWDRAQFSTKERIGICPYLLLPHTVIIHNEEIVTQLLHKVKGGAPTHVRPLHELLSSILNFAFHSFVMTPAALGREFLFKNLESDTPSQVYSYLISSVGLILGYLGRVITRICHWLYIALGGIPFVRFNPENSVISIQQEFHGIEARMMPQVFHYTQEKELITAAEESRGLMVTRGLIIEAVKWVDRAVTTIQANKRRRIEIAITMAVFLFAFIQGMNAYADIQGSWISEQSQPSPINNVVGNLRIEMGDGHEIVEGQQTFLVPVQLVDSQLTAQFGDGKTHVVVNVFEYLTEKFNKVIYAINWILLHYDSGYAEVYSLGVEMSRNIALPGLPPSADCLPVGRLVNFRSSISYMEPVRVFGYCILILCILLIGSWLILSWIHIAQANKVLSQIRSAFRLY